MIEHFTRNQSSEHMQQGQNRDEELKKASKPNLGKTECTFRLAISKVS